MADFGATTFFLTTAFLGKSIAFCTAAAPVTGPPPLTTSDHSFLPGVFFVLFGVGGARAAGVWAFGVRALGVGVLAFGEGALTLGVRALGVGVLALGVGALALGVRALGVGGFTDLGEAAFGEAGRADLCISDSRGVMVLP